MILKNNFFFTAPRKVVEIESLGELTILSMGVLAASSLLANSFRGGNFTLGIDAILFALLDLFFFFLLSYAYRVSTREDFNAEDSDEMAKNKLANFAVKRDALLASQLLSFAYITTILLGVVQLFMIKGNFGITISRGLLVFAAHFLAVLYFMPKIIQTEKAKKLKKGWFENNLTTDVLIVPGYMMSALTYFVSYLVCYIVIRQLIFF